MDNQQEIINDDFWRYWLFGVIDGDGCFYITVKNHKKPNRKGYVPGLKIVSGSEKLVSSVHYLFKRWKVPDYILSKAPRKSTWNVTYEVWIVGLKRMKHFIDVVGEYNGVKRGEFNLIKDFVHSRLSGPQNNPLRENENKIIQRLKNNRSNMQNPGNFENDVQQAAWVGGIMDTDGSFGIYTSNKSGYYRPLITLANKDPMVIQTFTDSLNNFGIEFSIQNGNKMKDGIHRVRMDSKPRCRKFVKFIGNSIVSKYPQIEVMKDFFNLPFKEDGFTKERQKYIAEKIVLLNHQ